MNESTAQLNNYRQSPRKVRVVADLVRGKKAADALITLEFADKRGSLPIRKLIASAIANAKAQSIDADTLMVKNIEVNAGKILYRRLPAAYGSPHPMRKRTSRIFVTLMSVAPKSVAVLPKKTKTKKTTTK